MAIESIIEPGKIYTLDQFQRETPPGSLAFDGIVVAQTQFTATHGIIDHHLSKAIEDPSTCVQIYDLIREGNFDRWKRAYVNHGDEDVCLSLYLTQHLDTVLADQPGSRLHKLLFAEDLLDRNAGMHNLHCPELEEQIAWIFEPYHTVRFNGTLPKLKTEGLTKIIIDVHERISMYLGGRAERRTLDNQYHELGHTGGYTIVDEDGPGARMAMARKGIQAFISLVGRTNGNGPVRYRYSLYRDSTLSPEDALLLETVYTVLNTAEGISIDSPHRWNGTRVRGGSPREIESTLSPQQLIHILSQYL